MPQKSLVCPPGKFDPNLVYYCSCNSTIGNCAAKYDEIFLPHLCPKYCSEVSVGNEVLEIV
jgi:hypothetical protein